MTYIFIEIAALFVFGGLYYLYQRKKYLRYHEKVTLDFMEKMREIEPNFPIAQDHKTFELDFVRRYKLEKNLEYYPPKLHDVLSQYISYIESISGPLI